MDPSTIQDRFEKLKAQRPFSARWLSETMKINRYSINKVLRGEITSRKNRQVFRAVLEKLGTTEAAFLETSEPGLSESASAQKPHQPLVPLFGDIPAGNPTWFEADSVPAQWIEPPPGVNSPNLFALRVQGESMLPRFEQGDIVYFERLDIQMGVKDPEHPIPPLTFERLNGRVVAALIDGEATMKQLKVVGDGDSYVLLLKPFNPDFRTITVRAEHEIRFQGVALSMLRQKL